MGKITDKLNLLPQKPGVYLMKDSSGQIIYVGKAKILRNRVRSYFTGTHDGKTQKMISLIEDFEYIITDSEVEALVLECNLIKKYNPKYNILLRDDKSYPYLIITKEQHPRILTTRITKKGQGKYFGPYPNATAAKEAARLLNRLFPLRKCRSIPSRPCLYYHLDQCMGPCFNEIEPTVYEEILKEIELFLRGDQHKIINYLEKKMLEASESLQYERAKEFRDIIEELKQLGEKQKISLTDFLDRDVVGYASNNEQMCIVFFYLRQGKLLSKDTFIFPYYEEPNEAFISFLAQFYYQNPNWPKEILIPQINTEVLTKLFPIAVPKKGKKLDLVNLANSNAETTLFNETHLESKLQSENKLALAQLCDSLEINDLKTIEAFDISNTGGSFPVGGMVQFLNGNPNRAAYRKFKINLTEITDDTAAMNQVIERRYKRVISDNSPIPNLILVDGGKGQINAARKALERLSLTIPVAGMVKDDKHQTSLLLDFNGNAVPLPKNSSGFHLIERIQNEVHRFAITFHRQQRSKNMTLSLLDGIPGIGPKRRQLLLKTFQSINGIKEASVEELQATGIPNNAVQAIYAHFHKS